MFRSNVSTIRNWDADIDLTSMPEPDIRTLLSRDPVVKWVAASYGPGRRKIAAVVVLKSGRVAKAYPRDFDFSLI